MHPLRLAALLAVCAPLSAFAQTLSDFSSFVIPTDNYFGTWSANTTQSNATTLAVGNFGSGNPRDDGGFFINLGSVQDWSGYTTVYLSGFVGAAGALNANTALNVRFYIEDIYDVATNTSFSLATFSNGPGSTEQGIVINWGGVDKTAVVRWGFVTEAVPLADFAFTFDRVGFSAFAIPEPSAFAGLSALGVLSLAVLRRARSDSRRTS